MATRSTPKKSRGEPPAPKKVRPKKAQPKGAGANGPTEPAGAEPRPKVRKTPRFNATTIQAMEDARTGKNVTIYRDEDELFQKLGIPLGKVQTKAKAEG
jgi:hypothetical protein